MDMYSTIGAASCLEFAVFMMAAALFLDHRGSARSERLWRNVKSILETANEPAFEPVRQRAA